MIKRGDAKKMICKYCVYGDCKDCRVMHKVDEISAADVRENKPGRWISVSERLPDKAGNYLCWAILPYDDKPGICVLPYDDDCEAFGAWQEEFDPVSFGSLSADFYPIDVLFWMSLPEPPEEVTTDDKGR